MNNKTDGWLNIFFLKKKNKKKKTSCSMQIYKVGCDNERKLSSENFI